MSNIQNLQNAKFYSCQIKFVYRCQVNKVIVNKLTVERCIEKIYIKKSQKSQIIDRMSSYLEEYTHPYPRLNVAFMFSGVSHITSKATLNM